MRELYARVPALAVNEIGDAFPGGNLLVVPHPNVAG